jgi:hypothetical protein
MGLQSVRVLAVWLLLCRPKLEVLRLSRHRFGDVGAAVLAKLFLLFAKVGGDRGAAATC